MLPNLNDLAAGIQFLRTNINGRSGWTGDPVQHAAFLVLTGGGLPDDVFRMALGHAVNLHHWDEDTIARIVRTAIAVDQVADLTGSTRFRSDPTEMAKAVAAEAASPRRTPDLPDSVAFDPDPVVASILDGIKVGAGDRSMPFNIPFGGAIIAAQRGGGKTNLLHNVIAGVAQTSDATVWVGDTDNQLLMPWLRTDLTRRLIGWPAFGVRETMTMLDAAIELIHLRKTHGADMMRRMRTDVYPISAADPAVLIVIDAECLDHPEVMRRVVAVRRMGRAGRVEVISGAQSMDADHVSAKERKLTGTFIVGQLSNTFEYDYLPSRLELPDRSGRFISAHRGDQAPFQAAHITPRDIKALGEDLSAIGHTPPLLPAQYQDVTGYLQRWEQPEVQDAITAVGGWR